MDEEPRWAHIFQVSEQSISPTVPPTKVNDGIRLRRERLLSAWLQIHFVHKINFGSLHLNQKFLSSLTLSGNRNNSAMQLGQLCPHVQSHKPNFH